MLKLYLDLQHIFKDDLKQTFLLMQMNSTVERSRMSLEFF